MAKADIERYFAKFSVDVQSVSVGAGAVYE